MALSRKRACAEAEALPQLPELRTAPYDFRKRPKGNAHAPQHTSPAEMGPPPTPIDPSLESLNTSQAQKFGLDQLLPTAPDLQQRPFYPREINIASHYFHEGPATSMGPRHLDLSPSLNSHPDPWDSQRIGGRTAQPQLMNQSYTGARERSHQYGAQAYWDTRSDIDSSTGRHIPDSGYYTQTHDGSIYSGDLASNQECQSLTGGMAEPEPRGDAARYGTWPQVENSMDCSNTLPEEQHPDQAFELICHICQHKSKNRSESSKHKLRHDKPFKCDVEGCRRATEGFTTQNDLDRHRKSLHNVMTGKSFMCAVQHCAKKTKVWPRADNFRQHCQRLHKDYDLNELMDRSWERGTNFARNAGKEFGLVEAPPNDGRFHTYDPTQIQLVNPQEISKAPKNENLMEAFQPSNGTTSLVDGSHKLERNDVLFEEDRTYYQDTSITTIGRQDTNLDMPGAIEGVESKGPPVSHPLETTSKLVMPSHTANGQNRLNNDPSVRLSNGTSLQTRENCTSVSSGLTRDDLTSIISDLVSGLDPSGCRNKDDVRLAIQTSALNLLATNKSKKRNHADSPSKGVISDSAKQFQCQYCKKTKKAQCELRKHEKRHTRPYGCTYSNCPRRFGSKDDWKRHENTMHWQVEAWKCAEPLDKPRLAPDPACLIASNQKRHQCGQVFYRREQFQDHLQEFHEHKNNPEYVREQCKFRRVGRNGQRGFWCGFCQTVVSLKKRGLEAWDERFTHIDEEHFKKGQKVDDWFPMDKELPKGILDEEKQNSDSAEEGNANISDIEDPIILVKEIDTLDIVQNPQNPRKEKAGNQATKVWWCCGCSHGPLNPQVDMTCSMQGCAHRRCSRCRYTLE